MRGKAISDSVKAGLAYKFGYLKRRPDVAAAIDDSLLDEAKPRSSSSAMEAGLR